LVDKRKCLQALSKRLLKMFSVGALTTSSGSEFHRLTILLPNVL